MARETDGFIQTGDDGDSWEQQPEDEAGMNRQTHPNEVVYGQPVYRFLPTLVDAGFENGTGRWIQTVEKKPKKSRKKKLTGRNEAIQIEEHFYSLVNPRNEKKGKKRKISKEPLFQDLPFKTCEINKFLPHKDEIYHYRVRNVVKMLPDGTKKFGKILIMEMNTMNLVFTSEKRKFKRFFKGNNDQIFESCVLYMVENVTNDNYWIVFMKLMKFSRRFMETIGIFNNELVTMVRDIRPKKYSDSRVEEETVIDNGLYDIEIVDVDLDNYVIRGYRWRRDTRTAIPFYFQILKSDRILDGNHLYYVLTNLYTHENDEVLATSFGPFDNQGSRLVPTAPVTNDIPLKPLYGTEIFYVGNGTRKVLRYPMKGMAEVKEEDPIRPLMMQFSENRSEWIRKTEMALENNGKGNNENTKKKNIVRKPGQSIFDDWMIVPKKVDCYRRMNMNLTFAIIIPYINDYVYDTVFLNIDQIYTFFGYLAIIDSEHRFGLPNPDLETSINQVITDFKEPQPMEQIEEHQGMVPIEDPSNTYLNGNPEK